MQDPLSAIVNAASITGAIFLEANLTAPWAIYSQVTSEDCAGYLKSPAHLVAYHVIVQGRLYAEVNESEPIEVKAGELILLPNNCRLVLSSRPGVHPADAEDLILPGVNSNLVQIKYGGGGEPTKVFCGFLASEVTQYPLFEALPDLIKLDLVEDMAKDWIESSVQYAAVQLREGQLASSNTMSRLSELLLVEAIRNYIENEHVASSGWIKGMTDMKIGKALELIHKRLDKTWTANELASNVAMSRSSFVDRFTSLVGIPPIRYLAISRLGYAKSLLRETDQTTAEIGHMVGYESAVAFNRAFKREYGVPPAQWRTSMRIK